MRQQRRNPAEVTAEADLINPQLRTLVEVLRRAERTVRSSGITMKDSSLPAVATYSHLYEELEEIAYLLKIASRSILSCAQLQPQLNAIQDRPGAHNYDHNSEEARIFSLAFEYRREVLVINKAVHEWFNHIAAALKLNQKFFTSLGEDIRRDLSYVVLIRDKLLTHKKDPHKLSSGSSGYENLATVRVHRMPLDLSDEVIAEINGIFRGCLQNLPPECQSELNPYEQFSLLAHYHEAVDSKYRPMIKSLVEKYGAKCPSLEELAGLATRLAENGLIPLSEDIAATSNDS